MDKRKIIIGLIACLVLSTFGIAGYLLSVETSITGHTTSSNSNDILYFEGTFEDFETLNLTSAPGSDNKGIILTNSNGFLPQLKVTIESSFVSSDPQCTIVENECFIEFYLDGEIIEDGDIIDITSGSHNLNSTLSCDVRSCPQEVTATISIAE